MTYSEDYKRGALDMLDALTVTSNSGAITARYREEYDWRSADGVTPLRIALSYREELENRKALQDAVNLLEQNGYYVALPHLIPEYEKAADYLRKGGYQVNAPPARQIADDESARLIRRAVDFDGPS